MEEWNLDMWKESMEKEKITALYIYTPMCGTCLVANKMMQVVEQMLPDIPIGKMNINFSKQFAIDYKIESVPCLLISKSGKITEKVYAFKSIQNLLEKLN